MKLNELINCMYDIKVRVLNYSEQGKEIHHDDVKNLKFNDKLKLNDYKVMYIIQEQKELAIYVVKKVK